MKILLLALAIATSPALQQLPVYQDGRFRPAESAAREWLHETYGRESLKKSDREAFGVPSGSALALLWKMQLEGRERFDPLPLFLVNGSRLSYNELQGSAEEGSELWQKLRLYESINHAPEELERIVAGLKLAGYKRQDLAIALEGIYPLRARLLASGSLFNALPTRQPGVWAPLNAFDATLYNPANDRVELVGNFTPFSDETYRNLRTLYHNGEIEELALALHAAYEPFAGAAYVTTTGKALHYPTKGQLFAEALLYKLPLLPLLLLAYVIVALLPKRRLLTAALLFHTLILATRCYVLARPPVANMFETLLWVPWVLALAALPLRQIRAGAIGAAGLILLLQLTPLSGGMENVQAVLDSNLWLSIHVLMVVGSYGIFLLGALLAHFYLAGKRGPRLTRGILHSMYLGTALLIGGTLLGGVWAAQSWGRFWDWDPKESWAFISILIYLAGIHLHRFKLTRDFGLAMSAAIGFFAISFTWYGVNYILGTGLHSYGFGHGGGGLYLTLLGADAAFLAYVAFRRRLDNSAPTA